MKEFDRSLRHTRPWANWEQNKAHHHAIRYAKQLYPVKKVVSIATGVKVREFHARDAKDYIEREFGKNAVVPHPSR
jgi:5-methylcytosine-specific restriction protein A